MQGMSIYMESGTGTKVKICGLSRKEDIEYANEVHPDYIGFVFWEKSRRMVDRETAEALRKNLDAGISVVGVFVDAPCEEVISLLEDGIIDIAQLHGEETEEDIQYIQAVTHKPVMKAVRVRNRYEMEAWLDSSADYLLFDSGMGSGEVFNWELLAGIDREFFLAGGLDRENLPEAISSLEPFAVDVSSGVETEGKKDLEKMRAFVKQVRETV